MNPELTITTPLGDVRVSIEAIPAIDPSAGESVLLSSGARMYRWTTPGKHVLLVLVVKDDARTKSDDFVVSENWGVVWTLEAISAIESVDVRTELAGELLGEPDPDERLAAVSFETPTWVMDIGGPDHERLSDRIASGDLPASWRNKIVGAFPPAESPYGDFLDEHGPTWRFPAQEPGESATAYVSVAWGPAGLPHSETATWNAVDTSPDWLMEIAGIAPMVGRSTNRWNALSWPSRA